MTVMVRSTKAVLHQTALTAASILPQAARTSLVIPAAKLAVNALPENGHAGMALLPASVAAPERKSSVTVSITTAMASSTTNRTLAPPFAVRARFASTPEGVVSALHPAKAANLRVRVVKHASLQTLSPLALDPRQSVFLR